MPIEHRIDHQRRLVIAMCRGQIDGEEIFLYQRAAWSKPEVTGYDELFDASELSGVGFISSDRMRDLAALAADMDAQSAGAKLAIVASKDHLYALGRMYQSYFELNENSDREVRVFHDRAEALRWLGHEDL